VRADTHAASDFTPRGGGWGCLERESVGGGFSVELQTPSSRERWVVREHGAQETDGTKLRAPTADEGLAGFCRDTFSGHMTLRVWRKGARFGTGAQVLCATSTSAALEVRHRRPGRSQSPARDAFSCVAPLRPKPYGDSRPTSLQNTTTA